MLAESSTKGNKALNPTTVCVTFVRPLVDVCGSVVMDQ